ncbi:MAG TPA: TIGR00180 family glycosyltransferase [Pyrinomonadaceae bacterium]|nr:TIGR00180 family glycosyltransferase [Pyrinomonadaceae bacterium]
MNKNPDLTILLTLWDRVPCTFRWMSYASKINLPFKVLIADGGSDQSVPAALADPARYPNVDYEYIRYPYDATPTHYYAKVLDALGRVKTAFVVLGDNDDFFVIDALLRSVEFLKGHPDFSSCRGIIGGVRISPDPAYGEFSNVYGNQVSFVSKVYPDKSTLEETAVGRVHNYFSSYRANWYDVFRTEQTRMSFRVLRDLDTQDLILSQHIPMLLGVIAGKVQVEPYLYLVRQLEGLTSCDQIETREKGDLFDRMLADSWSADFKGFLDAMSAAVSEKDGISIEMARQRIKEGYRTLMTPGIVGCLLGSLPPGRSTRIKQKLSSHMGPAGTALLKLYPAVSRLISGQPLASARDSISAEDAIRTDVAFKPIYEFLAIPPQSIPDSRQTDFRSDLQYSSSS